MRLGQRRIIHISADIQVVIVVAQGGDIHHVADTVDPAEFIEGSGDLLDMLG
ncbi:hypothetical protein D9M71_771070 [compost metagenome]